MSDEARLIKTLTQRYERIGKLARPVVNSSTPVKVYFGLTIYQLIDVDESEQFIALREQFFSLKKQSRNISSP